MRFTRLGCPVALGLCVAASLCASAPSARADDLGAASAEQSLSEMVRRTILENLPRELAGENDWGDQRKVFSGLKIKTNDGRLRISKRTKEVNNGLWTQYKIIPVDPQQQLHVRVAGLRRIGPGRVAFQLFLSARLEGEARVERWRRGVKMLNFKADSQSTVEALLDCEVGIRLATGQASSALVIEPKVSSVKLSLVDVDLQRVSRIDGPAAQELGDHLRPLLEKELRDREAEVTQKLNAAIDQHRDKLRFSTQGLWAAGWDKAQALLSTISKLPAAATPQPPPPSAPETLPAVQL